MKVGTDGVLLGCIAPAAGKRILDIGTGSGLIALMLAQRNPEAIIDGIDIDSRAAEQAADNFAASPWAPRLQAYHSSLQAFASAEHQGVYQLIVSNPPYFVDSLKNPDKAREVARHTDTLSYEELIDHSARLLAADGQLALILPTEVEKTIIQLAAEHDLRPIRICYVHTTARRAPKRIVILFQPITGKAEKTICTEEHHLTLIGEDGAPRSMAYQELTKDFYL